MAAVVARAVIDGCLAVRGFLLAHVGARPVRKMRNIMGRAGSALRPAAPASAADPYLVQRLTASPHEMLTCLYYDGSGAFLTERVHRGDPASVCFDPAILLRCVLDSAARYAVIAHNHPSGQARPSAADIRATRRVHQLLASLGVRLVDHVIVTQGGDTFSFRQAGLL